MRTWIRNMQLKTSSIKQCVICWWKTWDWLIIHIIRYIRCLQQFIHLLRQPRTEKEKKMIWLEAVACKRENWVTICCHWSVMGAHSWSSKMELNRKFKLIHDHPDINGEKNDLINTVNRILWVEWPITITEFWAYGQTSGGNATVQSFWFLHLDRHIRKRGNKELRTCA